MADYDFVSDLNETGENNISVQESGGDSGLNLPAAEAAPVAQPKAEPKQVAAEPAAGDKPLSLRDQISSALKGEPATPEVAAEGVTRNPDGTFAAKVAEPVIDPAAAPAVAAPQGIAPEVFASLPAETQASLARTMEDVARNQQRFATLEPLEQVLAPRVQAWALNGMQPAQAVNQLLALSDFATSKPAEFINYFAQQNGIDLEELVLGAEPVDPQYAALQREIAELRGAQTAQTQQQVQAAHNARVEEVTAFASEKGQDGVTALRPYFEEVVDDLMTQITAVKARNPNWSSAQVLQEAYDRACWATPSVRNKMQEATRAATDAERLRASTAKVEQARIAGVSVKNGVPAAAPAAPGDTSLDLRGTIRAAIAAAS